MRFLFNSSPKSSTTLLFSNCNDGWINTNLVTSYQRFERKWNWQILFSNISYLKQFTSNKWEPRSSFCQSLIFQIPYSAMVECPRWNFLLNAQFGSKKFISKQLSKHLKKKTWANKQPSQLASDFYVSQYRASSSSSRMLGKYLDLVEGLTSNVDENILSIAVLWDPTESELCMYFRVFFLIIIKEILGRFDT